MMIKRKFEKVELFENMDTDQKFYMCKQDSDLHLVDITTNIFIPKKKQIAESASFIRLSELKEKRIQKKVPKRGNREKVNY